LEIPPHRPERQHHRVALRVAAGRHQPGGPVQPAVLDRQSGCDCRDGLEPNPPPQTGERQVEVHPGDGGQVPEVGATGPGERIEPNPTAVLNPAVRPPRTGPLVRRRLPRVARRARRGPAPSATTDPNFGMLALASGPTGDSHANFYP